MKRDIKKRLKEDEFVHGFSWVVDFVQKWKKEMIIAGAVIIGLAVIWIGLGVVRRIQQGKDSAVLGEILDLSSGLAKAPQNEAKLQALAEKGKFARVARVQLASYWVRKGNLDAAEKVLAGPGGGRKDFFYYQAQDLAAEIATLKGDPDRALKILRAMEDARPKEYLLDSILYHRAEALEKKGDKVGALAVYKKLQTDFSQSYFGYEAGRKAQKIEGR